MPDQDRQSDPATQPKEVAASSLLDGFECSGAACEDTCCGSWSMIVDPEREALYKSEAPEYLAMTVENPVGLVMGRDPETDRCVALNCGLCRIQKERGAGFQVDACHFFPRITRRIGSSTRMSASMSCPEIARRALFDDAPFTTSPVTLDRLPGAMRDVLPDGMAVADALSVMEEFAALANDPTVAPERTMVRLSDLSVSLTRRCPADWVSAMPFLTDTVDDRLLNPEPDPSDPFRLLLALAAMARAARHPMRERFEETFSSIEAGLGVKLDWSTFALLPVENGIDPDQASDRLRGLWAEAAPALAPVLRRWLPAELDAAAFPFGGLGNDPAERAAILGVRFATFRPALMCHVGEDGSAPGPDAIVRIAQSLARLLNHAADAELSLALYGESGWTREARLRGLLDDADGAWRREPSEPAGQKLPPVDPAAVDTTMVA